MQNIPNLSVIIPVYNEEKNILSTLQRVHFSLKNVVNNFEIIIVNDGSKDKTQSLLDKKYSDFVLIEHKSNRGYGASLKTGIKKSKYDIIAIIDADGTYPIESFPELLKHISDYDMVVGTRTTKKRHIPYLRRPAKWMLNKFASFIVKENIKDVNSGMRIFKKKKCEKYWNLYPEGFSFTTTITMSFIMDNLTIKNIPIDYFKRSGKSKIHPIKDTYNFLLLILRISMLFNPLRIFMPVFFLTTLLTIISIVRDIYLLNLTDTTVILFIFSILVLMIGLLADLINKRLK